jgi:Protein kinase domain/Putative zinc-finger
LQKSRTPIDLEFGDRGGRENMSPGCLSREQISRLLSGNVASAEVLAIEQHLEACDDCREQLESAGREGIEMDLGELAAPETASDCLQSAILRLKSHSSFAFDIQLQDDNHVDDLTGFLDPADFPGDPGRLEHYRIKGLIGRGGMGIVLRGHDTQLDRPVAIKVLRPEWATDRQARERFTREARAAAAVQHDNLVTIHSVHSSGAIPWIVMELVHGVSLQERLKSGPAGTGEILRVARDVAAGLASAHAKGLIHRDIKPANILIQDGNGRARITDFGLARTVEDPGLSQPGVIAGTPEYMSPEQARGETVDCRSDLFSLGLVLVAMATGQSPMRGKTVIDTIRRVCDERLSPMASQNTKLPNWFCELIDRLVEKEPARRIPSAEELLTQLLTQSLTEPSGAAKPKLRWVPAITVLLLLTLIFLWGIPGGGFSGSTITGNGRERLVTGPVFIAGREGSWKSLNEAIAAAESGDTIELAADKPVIGEPMTVAGKSLTIRAVKGHRPVIVAPPGNNFPLIVTDSDLTLENLEINWHIADRGAENSRAALQSQFAVRVDGGLTTFRNCRIMCQEKCGAVAINGGSLNMENCFLGLRNSAAIFWISRTESSVRIADSVLECHVAAVIHYDLKGTGTTSQSLAFESCSILGDILLKCTVEGEPSSPKKLRVSNCLLDVNAVCEISALGPVPWATFSPSDQQVEEILSGTLDWSEAGTVYDFPVRPVQCSVFSRQRPAVVAGPRTLDDWRKFWKLLPSASIEMELELQPRTGSIECPVWTPKGNNSWRGEIRPGAPVSGVGPE